MTLRFTDSHCHLTMADADAALDRARAQNVRGFVVPATKLDDAPEAVALAVPSCGAVSEERPPPNLPIGVRTAATR